MKRKIVIAEVNNVVAYPPVISLIENLVSNGHGVTFIGFGGNRLPKRIIESDLFHYLPLSICERGDGGLNFLKHIRTRMVLCHELRFAVKVAMEDAEILWTTSAQTVRILGKDILRYKNIMQLMELMRYGYWYKKILKYPIEKYAQHAWKVVVPEENRAYIQKIWWNLETVPYVLPNKPYNLMKVFEKSDTNEQMIKIRNDRRKKLLYLGGIWPDRDLKQFAKAVKKMGSDYCIYVIGKTFDSQTERQFQQLRSEYDIEYLGSFLPPQHLAFLEYAFIGLLPYKPTSVGIWSELNALYCAPNKIFEYAGFGIPMIGTDVLGLKQPFCKYNIGKCCDSENIDEIIECIHYIENNYYQMNENCKRFFDSVDLDVIVSDILKR